MKRLRLCLLVLLAVLLPVRGAMAAAMLCPPAGGGWPSELQATSHHPVDHERAPAAAVPHGHGSHDHAASGHGTSDGHAADASDLQHADAPGGAHDNCNMCSAFCSVTPLVGSVHAWPVPPAVGSQRYSALDAPAPVFLSDGQDRPPRSI